jgi:flagellar assembly protein FliH
VASLPVRLRGSTATAPVDAESGAQVEAREAWQRALEQGAREAREEGLRLGYEEGLRRGMTEAARRNDQVVREAVAEGMRLLDVQRAQLQALAGALETAVQDAVVAAEEDMVALCYEALCRIVGSEALRPEIVVAQIRCLLSQRSGSALLAVHVHPDDAALLPAAGAPWVPDPEVAVGGCVVRTRSGGLDLRLETALEACKAALLRTRDEHAREMRASRSSP